MGIKSGNQDTEGKGKASRPTGLTSQPLLLNFLKTNIPKKAEAAAWVKDPATPGCLGEAGLAIPGLLFANLKFIFLHYSINVFSWYFLTKWSEVLKSLRK